MSRVLQPIYCDNCDYLKGINVLGYKILYHKPCKPKEYKPSHVQSFIAPPGYVSRFMRDDASILGPNIGSNLRVARIDPDAMMSAVYKTEDFLAQLAPEPKIETLKIREYRNIFGAELRYVIDGEKLYYSDVVGANRLGVGDPRDHLRECMRYAEKPKRLEKKRKKEKKWWGEGIF